LTLTLPGKQAGRTKGINMNLYLLSQEINNDYDTFDSVVVAAETEEEAKMIHPHEYKENWDGIDSGSWCDSKYVNVEYLGEAKEGIRKGVICASYNAG